MTKITLYRKYLQDILNKGNNIDKNINDIKKGRIHNIIDMENNLVKN